MIAMCYSLSQLIIEYHIDVKHNTFGRGSVMRKGVSEAGKQSLEAYFLKNEICRRVGWLLAGTDLHSPVCLTA